MCRQTGAETEETHKKSARVANNDVLHATYHSKLQITVLVKIKKNPTTITHGFPGYRCTAATNRRPASYAFTQMDMT